MKRLVLLLLGLALCAGCATHYDITLNDGTTVTALGKPKYDQAKSGFFFKDALGNPQYVPQIQVRQIQPSSYKSDKNSMFIN